jgi:proline dehydrogenase
VPFGRSILLAAAQSDALNRFATKSPVVKRATRKFMPGEKPEDALDAGARIIGDGRGLIYTKLGEALTRLEDADAVRDHYLWFFDQIAARKLPAHVSVKPTQLGLDQSESRSLDHHLALAERAEAVGSALWIDMEDHTYVDRTLALYEAVKARFPKSGLAMQSYLYRTPKDLERLMPLKPIIRLVKGAYAEPESVAYPRKADTDQAFYDLSVTMLEGAKDGGLHADPGHARRGADRAHRRQGRPAGRGQGQVRGAHAVRHQGRRAGAPAPRGPRGDDAGLVRRRLVPLVHAAPGRAAGQRDVRGEVDLRVSIPGPSPRASAAAAPGDGRAGPAPTGAGTDRQRLS